MIRGEILPPGKHALPDFCAKPFLGYVQKCIFLCGKYTPLVRGEEREEKERGKGSCRERECDRECDGEEEEEEGNTDCIRIIPRSMAAAIRYFSLFLPTTKDIPPEKSWQLWLPLFSDFWQTWGNSPVWEVDLLRLYSRLAFHRVGQVG